MADTDTEIADRLLALADRLEPGLRASYRRMVATISDAWTLSYIEQLMTTGRLNEVVAVVEMAARAFAIDVNEAFAAGGAAGAAALGDELHLTIGFDRTNERAVQAMRANALRLVREITEAQRDAVRLAITGGIQDGLDPRSSAIAVRQSLGLTAHQQAIVNNYRRALLLRTPDALTRQLRDRRFDSTVARALRDGTSLSPEQVEAMTARYAERWRRYRSEVVTRTEALRSVHQGNEAMYRQAVENGVIPDGGVVRKWVTARDERVRWSHVTMNGQERGMNEPFTTGAGHSLMHPGDPSGPPEETIQCRCAVAVRLKSRPPTIT